VVHITEFYVTVFFVLALIIVVIIAISLRPKRNLYQTISRHIWGIPGLATGLSAEIIIRKEGLFINETQFLPVQRFQYAEHVQQIDLDHMSISADQKKVILQAITRSTINTSPLKPNSRNNFEREILQLNYINVNNEPVAAFFLINFSPQFCKFIARRINESTFKTAPENSGPYEI
jgi:hypothetical protein